MNADIQEVLKKYNILSHHNHGIRIASVEDSRKGFTLAKEILYGIIDTKSVLYLSGGRTPKDFYHMLAQEEKLLPGAVGLVDERYGKKLHPNSNEQMIKNTGLLRYFQMRAIKFYPILQDDVGRQDAAGEYDQIVRSLHNLYQKSVGILGIGVDGHTAGIAGNRKDLPAGKAGFQNPMFDESQKHLLVSEFHDKTGMYKERISMTFLGLSMLDMLVVLVFGEDKKEALDNMFDNGPETDIPSRFFKQPEIATKTLLITDQSL